MTGDLGPMIITPGTNVRPYPKCADNLLLVMLFDMAHTLFLTDHDVQPEMEFLEAMEDDEE